MRGVRLAKRSKLLVVLLHGHDDIAGDPHLHAFPSSVRQGDMHDRAGDLCWLHWEVLRVEAFEHLQFPLNGPCRIDRQVEEDAPFVSA